MSPRLFMITNKNNRHYKLMQPTCPILWWTFPHNYIVWMATRQMYVHKDSDTSLVENLWYGSYVRLTWGDLDDMSSTSRVFLLVHACRINLEHCMYSFVNGISIIQLGTPLEETSTQNIVVQCHLLYGISQCYNYLLYILFLANKG